MAILLIAEHDGEKILRTSLSALRACLQLGGEVVGVVATSPDCGDGVARALGGVQGIEKVLVCKDARFAFEDAEAFAASLVAVAPSFSHIVAAATVYGKNLMPRLAALIDKQQVSDIIEVVSAKRFRRPVYAGNAIATVESSESVIPLTVRTSAFDPVLDSSETREGEGKGEGEVVIEELPVLAEAQHSLAEVVEETLSLSERPELTSARIVISGGRGMQAAENFQLLEKIADKLKAAVGASRAAVDAGYVTNDYQVGQTGKIVAPDLYIAVGISGAIQHLAGMKDSKVIVAINKDADAPIFRVADYGLVADLFDALPELDKELEKELK